MALKKNTKTIAKTTKRVEKPEVEQEVIETPVETPEKPKSNPTRARKKPVEIDTTREVLVVNMTQGSLFYSARKGNGFLELDNYLDSDYMSIADLQIMKNSNRGIFEKGWLYIDDEEAIEYLKLEKFMESVLLPEELDELFEMHPQELKEEMARFSSSMKENIYQALKIKYEEGSIANVHVIRAIEETLNVDNSLSLLNA